MSFVNRRGVIKEAKMYILTTISKSRNPMVPNFGQKIFLEFKMNSSDLLERVNLV